VILFQVLLLVTIGAAKFTEFCMFRVRTAFLWVGLERVSLVGWTGVQFHFKYALRLAMLHQVLSLENIELGLVVRESLMF